MADIDFNFLFRGISELDGVVNDLAKIELLNEQLKNQELEYRKASREAAAARKQAAEESRAAIVAQINAELGIKKELENEIGIIEQLRQRIKLLKSEREKANDVVSINTYTKAITASTTELNKLLGVTDKFRGSNGFWREITQYASAFFAATQVADWTGKIFTAQSAVEGFQLSLKRLVGENQAKLIEAQLKTLIVDTPLGFDNATKGIERLIFAYQNAGVSTKNIVKDFEAFGNVAKGNDEYLRGIVKALDDVANTGKLTGQEILQFGNAGVNIIGLLAESTGKTRAEIKKMQADGTLSFDLVREAIIKAGSEGGKFAGAMSVAMSTVSGKFAQYKDAVFFALANVGNYFADSAKKTLAWGTSIIQSLFGTQKATEATLDILKTLTLTIGSYIVTTKAAGVASAAWALVEKGWLIIRGELILLTRQQAIANATLSESQLAAAASAQVFNNTLMKNPIGLIALAIGTAITAYQTYNLLSEQAAQKQDELNKKINDGIAPLKLEQAEFNALAKTVLNSKSSVEEKTKALDELKKRFPEQLKGIDNLKEAESKLGVVLKNTNADFAIRAKLLENEIRIEQNNIAARQAIIEKLEKENELKTARTRGYNVVTTGGQVIQIQSNAKTIEEDIKRLNTAVEKTIKDNAKLAESSADLTKKLVYDYKVQVDTIVTSEGKKNKEKIDSAKTLALIEEKSNNDAFEKTRITEQKTLALQRDIDVQRIKDSKASATKKAAEILRIEEEYFAKSSQLTNKWDEKEDKEQEKLAKERKAFSDGVNKALIKSEEDKFNAKNKLYIKDAQEIQKIETKTARELNKLQEDRNELAEKLRILDRISTAKTAKEITEIEREEKLKRTTQLKDYYALALQLAEIRLSQIKSKYGEESDEYKKQRLVVVQAEQEYTATSIKLVELRSDAIEKAAKNDVETVKKAMQFAGETANQIFGIFERNLQKESASTTDLVAKARQENARQLMGLQKDILSVAGSLATGDVAGAVTKGIGVIFTALDYAINERQRIAEAKMAKITAQIQDYINKTQEQVNGILSNAERVANIYGTKLEMPDFNAENTIEYAIEQEIKRGEFIVKNYETAVNNENALHEKTMSDITARYDKSKKDEDDYHNNRVKNITDSYDLEVKKINEKYDLLNSKAEQNYTEENVQILNNAATQLEALIKNEESLNSIRAEYAEKRNFINETFALADKKITSDMTAAEVKAINDSVIARNKALYDLQELYVDSLMTIADAEGQKRELITETGKIQQEINDNLAKSLVKSQAEEIRLSLEKETELAAAEEKKNAFLEAEATRHNTIITQIEAKALEERAQAEALHNDTLQKLAIDKDIAIGESAERLKELIIAQIAQIQIAMNNAIKTNIEEYQQLQLILGGLLDLYKAVAGEEAKITYPTRGGNNVPITNDPNNETPPPATKPRGSYATGTERLPRKSGQQGVDTELIYADAGERIWPTDMNNQLKAYFGKDLTNKQLFNYIVNPNYDYIANIGREKAKGEPIVAAINGLGKQMKNLKQVNVTVKNGIPSVEERISSRMTKFYKP